MDKHVWRRFWVLLPLLVVLVLGSRAYIRPKAATFEVRGMLPHEGARLTVEDVRLSREGVVEVVSVEQDEEGRARVVFRALADGEVEAEVGTPDDFDYSTLRVEDGAIIEGGVNFSGWESIHVSVCIFLAVAVGLFASALVRLWRDAWYGYEMVACGGGMLFCLFQLALFLYLLFRASLRSFYDLAVSITYAADYFVALTLVPMAVLAVLVSLSNISLIRHEGLRPVNLLGIGASTAWAIVLVVWDQWSWLFYKNHGIAGLLRAADSVIAAAIAFGECLLLSTIVCAWLASRHVPRHGVDYLIVLGCGLRADGTPCPLLAGRVDRAREFDKARVAVGDAPATFVPSGGQGPDEVMSEALSMRNYLVGHGVGPDRVLLEDRSETTRQNMAFSREVIERHAGCDVSDLRIGFSTTNYHVFRGYVCAHEAGMVVEGMGSRTRAYFWPNAFLREFIGLLAAQWRAILQTFVLLAGIYVLAEYVLLLA